MPKLKRKRYEKSALFYILSAFIPYTPANLKLSFKPNLFFDELERISRHKRQTLHNAYYQAKKHGLVELDGSGLPRLTKRGKKKVKPYRPKHLKKGVKLMVVFDIPEQERRKRDGLRLLLKECDFQQIQKSVWVSENDYKQHILDEIALQSLGEYVLVYESHQLN